jgi:hypothetical protein
MRIGEYLGRGSSCTNQLEPSAWRNAYSQRQNQEHQHLLPIVQRRHNASQGPQLNAKRSPVLNPETAPDARRALKAPDAMDNANTYRPEVTPRPDARPYSGADARPTSAPDSGSNLTEEDRKRALERAAWFKKKHDPTFRRLAGK